MRFEQYSNVLQLAAALSLAGWVARTPDSQLDPNAIGSQYSGYQDTRYHPYSNIHPNFYQGNVVNYGPSPMVQQGSYPPSYPQSNFGSPQQNIYDSKETEDTLGAFMELQELISWQDSYRRGDFKPGQNHRQQQVLPITNQQNSHSPVSHLDQISPFSIDDGYSSATASVGSPASTVLSDLSSNSLIDDATYSLSPLSDVFEPPTINEFIFENVHGASGYTPNDNSEFNIDEILGFEKSSVPVLDEIELAKLDVAQRPYANLNGVEDDLEYVNSPMKSPTLDEFIGSPMPDHNEPTGRLYDRTFDDPFNMQFTNSSAGNKYISETLLEMGDFDPSSFDIPIRDEDIDEALVASLSEKYSKSTAKLLIPTDSIKQEVVYPDHHIGDHDYPRRFQLPKNLQNVPSKAHFSPANLMKLSQKRSHQLPPMRNGVQSRTFAPQGASNVKMTKMKQQRKKAGLVWADFQYTTDEIVTMPVEVFNEVIKKLDAVRQHIARDIRRKGKNKLAARTCRKRKMDVIDQLDHGVGTLEEQRAALMEERHKVLEETRQIRSKTEWLNSYIFQHLRDSNGKEYSPTDFSLQYTSDGNVYLVPSGNKNSPSRVKV